MKYTRSFPPSTKNRWSQRLVKVGQWFHPSSITHNLKSLCDLAEDTAIPDLVTELEGDLYSGVLTEEELVEGVLAALPFLLGKEITHTNKYREITRFCELIKDMRKSVAKNGRLPSQGSQSFNRVTRRFNNFVQVNKANSIKVLVLLKLSNTEDVQLGASIDKIRDIQQEEWKDKFNSLCYTRELIGTTRFEGQMPNGKDHTAITLRWAWRQKMRFENGKMLAWQVTALQKINFFEDHNLTG